MEINTEEFVRAVDNIRKYRNRRIEHWELNDLPAKGIWDFHAKRMIIREFWRAYNKTEKWN